MTRCPDCPTGHMKTNYGSVVLHGKQGVSMHPVKRCGTCGICKLE